jgi:hypothetical protein
VVQTPGVVPSITGYYFLIGPKEKSTKVETIYILSFNFTQYLSRKQEKVQQNIEI